MASECGERRPFRFFVPMLRAQSGYLDWIQSNSVGLEIQDLLQPGALEEGRIDDLERFWRRSLKGSSTDVGVHGPLVADMVQDPARTREGLGILLRSMDFAQGIGARFFIVHPFLGIRPPGTCVCAATGRSPWLDVLQAAADRGLTLVLENSNEESPSPIVDLCACMSGGPFGLCLDLGHALRHSKRDTGEWLRAFAERLVHVHLYNATRDSDRHRALGDGEIDIASFIDSLSTVHQDVGLCLEMDVPQILASVPWLTGRGLFRLQPIQADLF